jgi:hypothetical protein
MQLIMFHTISEKNNIFGEIHTECRVCSANVTNINFKMKMKILWKTRQGVKENFIRMSIKNIFKGWRFFCIRKN